MTKPATLDVLICTAKDQDDWRRALAQCLPEATLHVGDDAPSCDYAVVWKPPHALFEVQTKLKAIFSLGAGVNGLLAIPSLPRHVPLVRMEDGFLRSVGLGSDLNAPASLVLDDQGIYFDPRTPSALETILETADFDHDELERARGLRARIVRAGISKYNVGAQGRVGPRERGVLEHLGDVARFGRARA